MGDKRAGMARAAAIGVPLAALGLALAGCSSSVGDSAAGAASATPTLASASPAKQVFANAKAAAETLVAARRANDRTAALRAAEPNATQKVFAASALELVEACQPGRDGGVSDAYDCYARYPGGSSHYYVDPVPVTGWRVVNFVQVAD